MSERPEEQYTEHVCQAPMKDYKSLTKWGEREVDLAPAGAEFPKEVAVCILTLDERVNVARAIRSVTGSGEVVVIDCGSSDGTVEIARSLGAKVIHHDFSTSARQRQWALEKAGFVNDWVLMLDADEWVPRSFARELSSLCGDLEERDVGGGWLRIRFIYGGQWVRRASLYPSWQMRLLHRRKAWYEDRRINAHAVTNKETIYMDSDLVHEDLKSLSIRVRKLERYARLEAIETVKYLEEPTNAIRGALDMRRRVKILVGMLPIRASVLALGRLFRGAWLDGRAGLLFVEDVFFQERLTRRYVRELRRQQESGVLEAKRDLDDVEQSCKAKDE